MNAVTLRATWAPRDGTSTTEAGLAPMACRAWRDPELVRIQVPDPDPGPHDVVIQVHACGICGSDTHCIETDDEGYVIFSGSAAFPCTLGHELAGSVIAVGSQVRSLKPGALVTTEGMLYCGTCPACERGLVNQCHNLDMLGFSHPGGLADAVVVPEKHCWSIEGLANKLGDAQQACELAALVEPIGCAYNGMFVVAGGFEPGAHIAVFGCGPIGLGAIALARTAGAGSITAFERVDGRLALARSLGATEVVDIRSTSAQGCEEAIRSNSGGWGADMVVEAAGAAFHTMPIIEASLAPAGCVVYLGRTGERAPIMLDVLVSKAARIVGARGHAGNGIFPQIIGMLETDRLPIESMITHRAPIEDYASAFERSRTREDGKIMLVQP